MSHSSRPENRRNTGDIVQLAAAVKQYGGPLNTETSPIDIGFYHSQSLRAGGLVLPRHLTIGTIASFRSFAGQIRATGDVSLLGEGPSAYMPVDPETGRLIGKAEIDFGEVSKPMVYANTDLYIYDSAIFRLRNSELHLWPEAIDSDDHSKIIDELDTAGLEDLHDLIDTTGKFFIKDLVLTPDQSHKAAQYLIRALQTSEPIA